MAKRIRMILTLSYSSFLFFSIFFLFPFFLYFSILFNSSVLFNLLLLPVSFFTHPFFSFVSFRLSFLYFSFFLLFSHFLFISWLFSCLFLLVACTRLFKSPCRSVRPSVCLSYFALFCIFWAFQWWKRRTDWPARWLKELRALFCTLSFFSVVMERGRRRRPHGSRKWCGQRSRRKLPRTFLVEAWGAVMTKVEYEHIQHHYKSLTFILVLTPGHKG